MKYSRAQEKKIKDAIRKIDTNVYRAVFVNLLNTASLCLVNEEGHLEHLLWFRFFFFFFFLNIGTLFLYRLITSSFCFCFQYPVKLPLKHSVSEETLRKIVVNYAEFHNLTVPCSLIIQDTPWKNPLNFGFAER